MMNTMEPHGRGMAADILTLEVDNARQRIKRAERELERTEEMVAQNIERYCRMRFLIEAADRLVKIDPARTGRVRTSATSART
jgi:hypothetical protein